MEKVGGLILAGETFSPHPVFVLALLKHLRGGEEGKGRSAGTVQRRSTVITGGTLMNSGLGMKWTQGL